MKKVKKYLKALFSMQAALGILALLIAACILGSVIPQGNIESYYIDAYPSAGHLILALKLDDVFHSLWFAVMTVLLCCNLLGCNLLRFPGIMRQYSRFYTPEAARKRVRSAELLPVQSPEAVFSEMKIPCTEPQDGSFRYGVKNRAGLFGAWLTHLGILIIIVGFSLGQMYAQKYEVYGVPGQTKPIGDTGLSLTIQDYSVILREDDTVEQYTSTLTVTGADGTSVAGTASVNSPLSAFGYTFYQNATGYAADLVILKDLEENETFSAEQLLSRAIQQEVICAGEFKTVEDKPDLVIGLRSVYPDYTEDSSGLPGTASDKLVNPGYLYMLYYQGQLLGMNVLRDGELITVRPYSAAFLNPRMYTLIEIRHDPFSWVTLIGGILLLIALVLSFYIRTEELWAVRNEEGQWLVGGYSRKGGVLFRDKLTEAVRSRENRKGEKT